MTRARLADDAIGCLSAQLQCQCAVMSCLVRLLTR